MLFKALHYTLPIPEKGHLYADKVCLIVEQGVDLVGGEDLVGDLLQLGRSDLLHLGEGFLPCWRMMVIKHLLCHRQGIILLILRRNSHLPL